MTCERCDKLVEALDKLERAATDVARQGAVTGPQWHRLTTALLIARNELTRATLKEHQANVR